MILIRAGKSGWLDDVSQRLTVDELSDDEPQSIGFADFVKGDDVRMIECGHNTGLLLKPANALGVFAKVVLQDFQRDPPFESRVLCQIDRPHPAAPYLALKAVMTELTSCERFHLVMSDQQRGRFHNRLVDHGILGVSGQHTFDSRAQFVVAGADFIE
jgi:hypothetical protein